MGFGSYDESEQETPDDREEDTGEDYTEEIKGKAYKGTAETEDDSTEELMKHL